MQTETRVSERDLEAINALIVGDGWNADTAHNIQCALEFLADAIPAVSPTGLTEKSAHGVHVLLRACASALEVCHG
jgi:hypothetical protein